MSRTGRFVQRLRVQRAEAVSRRTYTTHAREPFFALALEHLAAGPAVVLDIGAGDGRFADAVSTRSPDAQMILLDGNPEAVLALRRRFGMGLDYRVPDRMPVDDDSVDLVHCSHLVEHLGPDGVYALLGECDRVLRRGGHLVVSAPLLWDEFYADLSHIKPYPPNVFTNYLSRGGGSRTRSLVSSDYETVRLQHRYRRRAVLDGVTSDLAVVDYLLSLLRYALSRAGVVTSTVTGFTLVMRKGGPERPTSPR